MVKKEGKEKRIQKLKKESRRYNIKEGIFNAGKDSLGTEYVSPFAIAINSSDSLVAMLSSLPGILGPLSQIAGSRRIGKVSRKKIVTRAILLESLVWVLFVGICFLFMNNLLVFYLPFLVLALFSMHSILGNFLYPAWFSWTGDLIDESHRGRWFSKRSLLLGVVSLVLVVSSAFFLDFLKSNGRTIEGFVVLFSLAFILRILSYRSLKKAYEPEFKIKKGDYFSFWQFLKKAPETNFGKFAIYRALISFSSAVSSSLLAVYLLRNIGFGYTSYMVIIYAGTFFSLLCLELWGKIADRYGNYFVICITSLFIPVIPILWILHPSFVYLLIAPSLVEGITWAGFNLATGNFVYDNVRTEKRGLAVSYYNMLRGIGIFLGAGLSAILIAYLKISSFEPIVAIFFLGAALRMLVVFFFLNKVKETKSIRKNKGYFKEIILKQAKPALVGEVHDIISIKEYFKK